MGYGFDREAHSVYAPYYYPILVVKHRKKVFTNGRMVAFLKQKIYEISKMHGVEILSMSTDQDHLNILFKAKPTLNIPKYINANQGEKK